MRDSRDWARRAANFQFPATHRTVNDATRWNAERHDRASATDAPSVSCFRAFHGGYPTRSRGGCQYVCLAPAQNICVDIGTAYRLGCLSMNEKPLKLIPYGTRLPVDQVRYLRRKKGWASRWLRTAIANAISRESTRAKRTAKAAS